MVGATLYDDLSTRRSRPLAPREPRLVLLASRSAGDVLSFAAARATFDPAKIDASAADVGPDTNWTFRRSGRQAGDLKFVDRLKPFDPAFSRITHEKTLSVFSVLDAGSKRSIAAFIVIAPISFPSSSTTGMAASCPPTIR